MHHAKLAFSLCWYYFCFFLINFWRLQGRIQDFKLGGAHLKKMHRAEGGAKNFGYFVWKITILRQKIVFFPIAEGKRENFWGISCEKSRFYAKKIVFFPIAEGKREHFWGISCEKSRFYEKKIIFFPILGGARAGCVPPPLNPPLDFFNIARSAASHRTEFKSSPVYLGEQF